MKRILTCVFCCCMALWAEAQTLDECRRLAREHYPEIRRYDPIRKSERYDLSNAARAWLPQLTLGAQATWQNEVPAFPEAMSGMLSQTGTAIEGLRKEQYRVSLELNQTLWDGGQSRAGRELARAGAAVERNTVEVDLYAVEGRVTELYFGILLLDERSVQVRRTVDLLGANLDKIRSLLKNGAAMASDADAVEAELLTYGQQLTGIESSRESYRRMLEIFIGRPLDGELTRPQTVEPTGLRTTETGAGMQTQTGMQMQTGMQTGARADTATESARPELALFEARSGEIAARELSVRSTTRPRFGFFAQGCYGYPGFDYFASMVHGNPSWNAMAGVRMSWNFGAFYTKKNRLGKLRAADREIDIRRDVFLFNLRLQTAQQEGEIARLRRALADDDRIVALRERVRTAAESKLRNGVIDTSELLGRITDEATARSARTVHEIELLKTIYELKHTLNR